jgi:hypothetical protein
MWDTKGTYDGINANISVPGILSDCYQLEATLGSTLECYYASACLALLHPTLNLTPLSLISSTKFQINTTIQTLLHELFIEQMQIQNSFNLYYTQCNPSLCTYIYSRRFDLLFMLTTIVGVCGGLATILKLIALLIVKAAFALHQRCRSIAALDHSVDSERNIRKLIFVILQRLSSNYLIHKSKSLSQIYKTIYTSVERKDLFAPLEASPFLPKPHHSL